MTVRFSLKRQTIRPTLQKLLKIRYDIVQLYLLYGIPHDLQRPLQCNKEFI